jgi:hypothetical protein
MPPSSHSDLGSLCITIMSTTTPTMPPKCHKTCDILETQQTRFVKLSLFSPLFCLFLGVHVDLCWNFIDCRMIICPLSSNFGWT